jgi:probable HAF family extracellular repeat protein
MVVAVMGVGVSPVGAAARPGDPGGGPAAAAVRYTLVDLGTLGGGESLPADLNDRGQVAGYSRIKSGHQRAFLWDPVSGMRDLGLLGGDWSAASALNERGQVAGGSAATFDPYGHAVLWDPVSGMRDLGTLGGERSWAADLNERGQVAGWATLKSGAGRAFRWDPVTGMRDLGTLGDASSEAVLLNERGQVAGTVLKYFGDDDIPSEAAFLWGPGTGMRDVSGWSESVSVNGLNERGQVVGYWQASSTAGAFLWDPTSGMRDLGPLGEYGAVSALNDRGQVAGRAHNLHAFLWDPVTGMRDLGTLGGGRSAAVAVNERGQVAGTSDTESGERHAFLWDPVTGMRDLGALGWDGQVAALNERGQVTGFSTTSRHVRAVLWTPVSLAPRVSVTVARAGYGNRLRVNVNPDRYRASEYWTFRVQKRTRSGSWTTLPTSYRTEGIAETRTLTLGAGVFRVKVNPRFGYQGATSAAVRLTAPTVKVAVRAVDDASRLFVDVDPNKGTGSWSFRVQKRTSSGSWTTLPTTYTTEGANETKTINLATGTYRVRVNPRYGYLGATSAAVRVAR